MKAFVSLVKLIMLLVLFLALLLPLRTVLAAAGPPADVPPLADLVAQLLTLGGFASAVGVLVNIGKAIGLVQNDTSQIWSTGLNVLGLVILFVLHVVGYTDFGALDQTLATLASLGTILLGLFLQLQVSKWAHTLLRGVPLIGFSYSLKATS